MATLAELRKVAKGMNIPATAIRGAENARELQKVIDEHSGGSTKPAKKKSAVKKSAVAKKKNVKKSAAKKSTAKKSNSEKSASSTKSPAKRTTAKRTSTAKRDGDSGRHMLEGVNYSETDGWNARDGSAPDRIVKALRKFKGNRSKVFDFLKGDVWDFAGKKKRDGSKRTKAEAEAMLVYRIARTDWDFALKTGQHEKSGNRVEYGTGGTGAGTFKRAGAKKSAAKKPAASQKGNSKPKSAAKRGRPAGSKNAARAAGKAAAKKNKRK